MTVPRRSRKALEDARYFQRPSFICSRYKDRYYSYRQIITDHFNIHATAMRRSNGSYADFIKIHITTKSKTAHALKQQGLPSEIRRDYLGLFTRALSRAIEKLAAREVR